MRKERIALIVLLAALVLLEIPVFWLWKRVSRHDSRENIPETTAAVTEAVPETTLFVETSAPEETMIPAETAPVYTDPPKITIDTVPHYYQNDYPNEPYGFSTVADSGSNMTALAMVASYLTDHEYYPDQMADWLAHYLGGHYQRLEYGSDLLGLSWTRAGNVHESLRAVKEGNVAIFLMNSNSMFTWKDHYIVVTGVNEEGLYTVLDPNRDHYKKEHLISSFENGFTEGYLIAGYSAGWVYDKRQMPEEPFIYQPEPPAEESRYPGLELTAEDKLLLAKLICMEAASEPFEGQQAVAEVVLNRLKSGRFGSSIHAIIHAEGQFPSVDYLYKAEPDYSQYKAIEQAQYGPYILPEDVVFYAKFKINDNYWGQIGNHYFCYSY